LGGGEVFTQLCDGSGCAARWQRVESDSQRAVAGVDVATAGEGLTARVWASLFARAYPVWTRIARAKAVAVLNATKGHISSICFCPS